MHSANFFAITNGNIGLHYEGSGQWNGQKFTSFSMNCRYRNAVKEMDPMVQWCRYAVY
jgi:hypothetical protein